MKILVVEDDPTIRESLKDIIELEGYQPLIAENGLRGLQLYNEFKPDLVISDIQMPKMDGLKMLEEIRKENTEAIVIIVTAHGSEEYAMQALRLGANNYLKKPFTTEELVFLLRKYDALVENRTIGHEILGMIVRKELMMVFDNRIDLIPKIVDHLVQETANLFGEQERLSVRVGLFELLVNAVEHGNLDITYHEKSKATESSLLPELYKERQSDPLRVKRRVSVNFRLDQFGCEWLITDEGSGFDWQSLGNPIDESNLLKTHGRGIFIARFQFDELEYQGKGNVVRAHKRPGQR